MGAFLHIVGQSPFPCYSEKSSQSKFAVADLGHFGDFVSSPIDNGASPPLLQVAGRPLLLLLPASRREHSQALGKATHVRAGLAEGWQPVL